MFSTGRITTWRRRPRSELRDGGGAELLDDPGGVGRTVPVPVHVEVGGVDVHVDLDPAGPRDGPRDRLRHGLGVGLCVGRAGGVGGAEDGLGVAGSLSGGQGGDQPDGLDLADPERVGIAVHPELLGDGADQVDECLQDQRVAVEQYVN